MVSYKEMLDTLRQQWPELEKLLQEEIQHSQGWGKTEGLGLGGGSCRHPEIFEIESGRRELPESVIQDSRREAVQGHRSGLPASLTERKA